MQFHISVINKCYKESFQPPFKWILTDALADKTVRLETPEVLSVLSGAVGFEIGRGGEEGESCKVSDINNPTDRIKCCGIICPCCGMSNKKKCTTCTLWTLRTSGRTGHRKMQCG